MSAARILLACYSAFFYYQCLVSSCQLLCAQDEHTPLVAAASDLTPAADSLIAKFQQLTGERVRFVHGASGALARQTAAGAPYDALLLANLSYIKDLESRRIVLPDTVSVYAVGRLAVWSSKGYGWEDLASTKVLHVAIANPAHAPYGQAARQALERAGLWNRVESKLVYGGNVEQALQFAKSGNADLVITARSLIPEGRAVDPILYDPIRQAAAVVKGARNEATARRFLQFLLGPDGQAILRQFGFDGPSK